jgi:hypothetical protein
MICDVRGGKLLAGNGRHQTEARLLETKKSRLRLTRKTADRS